MPERIYTNSFDHAVTTNYFDSGKRYYYRIACNASLKYKIDDGNWEPLPETDANYSLPKDCVVTKISADNNRLFILTEKNELYWRCMKTDWASWVVFFFTVASHISAIDAQDLIWNLFPAEMKWLEGKNYGDDTMWDVDPNNNHLSDWAADYRTWVEERHTENRWNSLNKRFLDKGTIEELSLEIDSEMDVYPDLDNHHDKFEIIDIAVGNWDRTVITYYILLKIRESGQFKLLFIDEEAVMQWWDEVPGYDKLPLNEKSQINASHSVIAISASREKTIFWTRYDYHSNRHMPIIPLNWTETWHPLTEGYEIEELPFDVPPGLEPPYDLPDIASLIGPIGALPPPIDMLDNVNYPGWHNIAAPCEIDEFLIDTSFGHMPWPHPLPYVDPRIPLSESFNSPIWKLYFLMYMASAAIDIERGRDTAVGFLGVNPITPNCNYPFCCVIKRGDVYMSYRKLACCEERLIDWAEITENVISIIPQSVRGTMSKICYWAHERLGNCMEWQEGACENLGHWGEEVCTDVREWQEEVCESIEEWEERVCVDIGGYECCDWWPCSWACDAVVWVAKLVCTGGTMGYQTSMYGRSLDNQSSL